MIMAVVVNDEGSNNLEDSAKKAMTKLGSQQFLRLGFRYASSTVCLAEPQYLLREAIEGSLTQSCYDMAPTGHDLGLEWVASYCPRAAGFLFLAVHVLRALRGIGFCFSVCGDGLQRLAPNKFQN